MKPFQTALALLTAVYASVQTTQADYVTPVEPVVMLEEIEEVSNPLFFWGSDELPSQIDYWDLLSTWYQSRGMSADEFERLREVKAAYRTLPECQDWPKLSESNVVPVYNSDEQWNEELHANGFFDPVGNFIGINPINNPRDLRNEELLLHEGLHSAQDHGQTLDTVIDVKYNFDKTQEMALRSLVLVDKAEIESLFVKKYFDSVAVLEDTLYEVISQSNLTDTDELYSLSGCIYDKAIFAYSTLNRADFSVVDRLVTIVSEELKSAGVSDQWLEKIDSCFEYVTMVLDEKNFLLNSDNDRKYHSILAGVYTGDVIELDPRLSEVVRNWYEVEGRTIDTFDEAKDAFDYMLHREVLPKYQKTQKDLLGVVDFYDAKGKLEPVMHEIYERLQGLL